MNETTSHALDGRLEQFEAKLNSVRGQERVNGDRRPKVVELDEKTRNFKARLRRKLEVSHGVDWELLTLELKNDLLLLINSFQTWTRRLDDSFNKPR